MRISDWSSDVCSSDLYDEDLRFAEDFAFYLTCFAAGARFYLAQQPLYRYRLRDDSLTALHSIEDLRRLQQVDELMLRERGLAREPGFDTALKDRKSTRLNSSH